MPENRDDIDLDDWDLHRAAKENKVDIARALIERGADIEAKDVKHNGGKTPLHVAAWKNSLDVARLLIEHGADIYAKNAVGPNTPLCGSRVQLSRCSPPADRAWCRHLCEDRRWPNTPAPRSKDNSLDVPVC